MAEFGDAPIGAVGSGVVAGPMFVLDDESRQDGVDAYAQGAGRDRETARHLQQARLGHVIGRRFGGGQESRDRADVDDAALQAPRHDADRLMAGEIGGSRAVPSSRACGEPGARRKPESRLDGSANPARRFQEKHSPIWSRDLRGTQEDGHDGQQPSPLANLHHDTWRHGGATGTRLDHRRRLH